MLVPRFPMPENFSQLFNWASNLLLRFECLGNVYIDVVQSVAFVFPFQAFDVTKPMVTFKNTQPVSTTLWRKLLGPDEVRSRFETSCLHLDSFFTGGDCPGIAMDYIMAAVRRRCLRINHWTFFLPFQKIWETHWLFVDPQPLMICGVIA